MKSIWMKYKEQIKYARFRTLLNLLFVALSVIPLVIMGWIFFSTAKKELIEQAEINFEQDAGKVSKILDKDLDYIEEFTIKLNVDNRIFEIFSTLNPQDSLELASVSNQIAQIFLSYLPWDNTVYSIHLVTSYYRFGETGKNFYPVGHFNESKMAKLADEAAGELVWIPTYDYVNAFSIENINETNLEYGRLFSAVRKLHPSKLTSGRITNLPENIEKPYLVVNFTEKNLLEMLNQYRDEESKTEYMVMTEDGEIVCTTNESMTRINRGKKIDSTDLAGCVHQQIDDEDYIISYVKNETTGWFVIATLPVSSLLANVVKKLTRLLVVLTLILVILSLLISVFISEKFNKKIYKPLNMIQKVGQGNFEIEVNFNPKDEFAFFYNELNLMNRNLKHLVYENYVVNLQKRDSEIMTLNIQLNPHFLYNTLNIINWVCREGDNKKAGDMIVALSRMLQYTSKNKELLVPLKEDLEWLENYVFIMSYRFDDLFAIRINIPEEYNSLKVPKLFLQPLVENAIVHGFSGQCEKGILEIFIELEDKYVIFCVEDNGCGMTQEQIRRVINQETNSIGIRNTDQRLRIIFGQEYGVKIISQIGEGTTVLVRVPDNR